MTSDQAIRGWRHQGEDGGVSAILGLLAYSVAVLTVGRRVLVGRTVTGSSPRLAVLAWQVLSISVPVSWVAGGVLLAVTAAERPPLAVVLANCRSVLHHALDRWPAIAWAGALGAAVLAGWILLTALRMARAVRQRRVRHRMALSLVGRPDPALGAVIVEASEPLVYCVPGGGGGDGGGMVVVTSGARQALTDRELRAVLAHERAHLAGRHHLPIGLAGVLARALPRLRLFGDCAAHTARLLEMRADDVAAGSHGALPVATALAALGTRMAPAGALGAGGSTAVLRVERLLAADQVTADQVAVARRAAERRRDRFALLGLIAALAAVPVVVAVLPFCPSV
jgi:Zn-dependent protease with chaperone function